MPEGSPLPERVRLFVALLLPEPVKAAIARAQQELRATLVSSQVRWTTLEQFHLTLRFLGSVETTHLPSLTRSLESVAKQFAPPHLQAAGIGCFPTPHSPRVVWAGIGDAEAQLGPLQRTVQQATLPFTAEPPEDRFTGHITLGRIKRFDRSEAESLAKVAAGFAQVSFGAWSESELHLMRSELSPKGARYSSCAAFSFSGTTSGK